jgi:serine/threonine protein kinase/tetratricopeptide (TPR) repeat protein
MIPDVGQKLGPYEILGKLGGGGMGLVFRAWDERLHREVAVKLLHDEYKMPQMRERFLQEARAASGLNHPNICTVFDIGEQDGNLYLVMELLEGETLKDRIARGAIPVEEIVRYSQEIATALVVAHAKGIVHRDVKPANIFLVTIPNGRSQLKVLDFGLAKIGLEVRGGWQSRMLDMALSGATVGTLAYMSPEQAQGESLDERTDLFSLGIVMYEMATRRVPFKGTTSELVLVGLFHREPESIQLWNESVPRELERVILKLLSKDRKGRFQTAQELADSLRTIAEKLGKGSWLSRSASIAPVPLVQASDPVAWHKHQRLQGIEAGSSGRKKLGASSSAILTTSNGLIQPAGTLENESAWVRSRSGVTPFKYGSDDPESQALLAEEKIQHKISATITVWMWLLKRSVRMPVVVALMIIVGGGIFLLVRNGLFRPMVLGQKDRLLLTVIQNKTGDQTLDGTVMQGLEIALRQSAVLNVLGGDAYRAGLRQIQADSVGSTMMSAQRVAEKVGARAYVYGEIRGSAPLYTISVDVLQTDTNDKVVSLQETARDRQQIPPAIGRLAQAVHAEIASGHTRRGIQLGQGTTNVDALHAYIVGEAAMQNGQTGAALEAYRRAVTLDPKFVQAQMRLAWLYRAEKAEVASADAAKSAQAAAVHVNEKLKLLAQFCYEMNASGDYGQAEETIRRYIARYPLDVDGMKGMARVLRLQGYLPEALLAAQEGYGQHPFDGETYSEAELALIGMDRYEAVLELQAQARRIGVLPDRKVLDAESFEGKTATAMAEEAAKRENTAEGFGQESLSISYEERMNRGLYLDGMGQMSEGLEVWNVAAAEASRTPGLASTQASMLAQGALDRALAESCSVALEMVRETANLPKGPIASFDAGMAAALCGDLTYAQKAVAALNQDFPRNTSVTYFYMPELVAAADIGVNEPAKALRILTEARAHEQISLIPYLRGLAHAALGQIPLAIADFQSVLAHKGDASVMAGNLYAMAEIGAARAYAADGDRTHSVMAYRRFLASWSEADRGQPRLIEAMARSR